MIEFRVRRWKPEDLAKRITKMLYGHDTVYFIDDSQKWQLGTGNDFWLRTTDDEDRYILTMRYSSQEKVAALAAMIQWRLRAEILSCE